MCLESEQVEWKCYCEGLRLAVAGAGEMKLPSIPMDFIPGEKERKKKEKKNLEC